MNVPSNSSERCDHPNTSLKRRKFMSQTVWSLAVALWTTHAGWDILDNCACCMARSPYPLPLLLVFLGRKLTLQFFAFSFLDLNTDLCIYKSGSSDAVAAIKCCYSPSHHSSLWMRTSSSFSDSDLSFMQISCSCLKENYAAYRRRGKNWGLNIALTVSLLFPEGSRLVTVTSKSSQCYY